MLMRPRQQTYQAWELAVTHFFAIDLASLLAEEWDLGTYQVSFGLLGWLWLGMAAPKLQYFEI